MKQSFLEKLTGPQFVEKFLAFYGKTGVLSAFRTDHHLSLF
jgi:hypothetical protein